MDTTEYSQDQIQRTLERRDRDSAFFRHHPEYLTALIARHTVYRARVGKRTAFPSSHDAVQYERGFNEFPNQPPGLPDSARMQGYHDAEEAAALALAASGERRAAVLS